jgi:hypothetical protein
MMKNVDRTGDRSGPPPKKSSQKMNAVRPQKIANLVGKILEEVKDSVSPEEKQKIENVLQRNGGSKSNHT